MIEGELEAAQRAGLLTIGLYKECMKYERLLYNEDYISPRRKVKQFPESKITKTVAILERNW